jgi:hypothetical protein
MYQKANIIVLSDTLYQVEWEKPAFRGIQLKFSQFRCHSGELSSIVYACTYKHFERDEKLDIKLGGLSIAEAIRRIPDQRYFLDGLDDSRFYLLGLKIWTEECQFGSEFVDSLTADSDTRFGSNAYAFGFSKPKNSKRIEHMGTESTDYAIRYSSRGRSE